MHHHENFDAYLAFTSVRIKIDDRELAEPPLFMFAQLYIFDTDNQTQKALRF